MTTPAPPDDDEEKCRAGTLYPDAALIERALRSARNRHPEERDRTVIGPRWAAVSEAFACGSTLARGLCRRFGLDPDEPTHTAPEPTQGEVAPDLLPSRGGPLVHYPFQLRPGRFVHLRFPPDLTRDEANRLAAFLSSLSLDATSAVQRNQQGADVPIVDAGKVE